MSGAIEIQALSKRYRLGTDPGGYDTLREALTRTFDRRRKAPESVWALRNLSFEVSQSETVGVIGRNGAGKTTLLKILAGITEPTSGEARVRGNVSALLEVGTGLHPELTGRENIELIGVILGLSRREVRTRFDEIVEFSGLAGFLETPVKRYSTGMRLRLAFSIAAHVLSPIVLLDEVLAVGDAVFREKCLRKVAEFGGDMRTVFFVSHDTGAVNRLCDRVIWLESGKLHRDGPAASVISEYLASGAAEPLTRSITEEIGQAAGIREVRLTDSQGALVSNLRRDRPFMVDITFEVRDRVPGLDLSIWILDETGALAIHDVHSDQHRVIQSAEAPGSYRARIEVPPVLAARRYTLGVWLGTEFETFFDAEVITLPVSAHPNDRQAATERPRVLQPNLHWKLEREEICG